MPVAKYFNISETSMVNFKPNSALEVYFKDKRVVMSESIYMVFILAIRSIWWVLSKKFFTLQKHLSRETGLDVEYIKEWFIMRPNLNKPTKLKKFTESFWRFFFYLSIWSYGFYILYQVKPSLLKLCISFNTTYTNLKQKTDRNHGFGTLANAG